MRLIAAVTMAVVFCGSALAQEPPKPGPEYDLLKKQVGSWTVTMKAEGMDVKGSMVYKMELGGLWLVGSLESELGGMKFYGRSLDSYDPVKKKYVSIWVDSMITTPMILEGTYDKEKKTLTMSGEGPGMDGKPIKWKSVSVIPDDDTINLTMYMGDAKEPAFTVAYKRKK
jgi:hypothetical protein